MCKEMREQIDNFRQWNENKREQEIISNAVKLITKKFNVEYGVPCEYINQGECGSFADDLDSFLIDYNIKGEILSDGLFFDPFGDEEPEMMCDISKYGNKPKDFNKIGLPSHYWFYYKGKHYDSDTPNGVTDVFDLPIIKKYYKKARQ